MKHTHTEGDLLVEGHYPKLVRDKIPEIIEREGRVAKIHIAKRDEYIGYLLTKLVEEATELKNANGSDHQKEEIADVKEVLGALVMTLEFSEHEIRQIQDIKRNERGGFINRIISEVKPEH